MASHQDEADVHHHQVRRSMRNHTRNLKELGLARYIVGIQRKEEGHCCTSWNINRLHVKLALLFDMLQHQDTKIQSGIPPQDQNLVADVNVSSSNVGTRPINQPRETYNLVYRSEPAAYRRPVPYHSPMPKGDQPHHIKQTRGP
jgi:hypothetical protein